MTVHKELKDVAPNPRDIQLVKGKVIRYFRDHPNAADSLEGIAKFWLSDLDSTVSQDELRMILEQLVSEGVVKKSIRKVGGTIYSSAKLGAE